MPPRFLRPTRFLMTLMLGLGFAPLVLPAQALAQDTHSESSANPVPLLISNSDAGSNPLPPSLSSPSTPPATTKSPHPRKAAHRGRKWDPAHSVLSEMILLAEPSDTRRLRLVAAGHAGLLIALSEGQNTPLQAGVLAEISRSMRPPIPPPGDFASRPALFTAHRLQVAATLEDFLEKDPQGEWSPAVHAWLGGLYRKHALYLAAEEHLIEALNAAQGRDDPGAREVRDAALAELAFVYASSGRHSDLTDLRTLYPRPGLRRPTDFYLWSRAEEKLSRAIHHPGVALRCGIFALDAVAQAVIPGQYARAALLRTPAQIYGLSLLDLEALANGIGLPWVA